MARGVTQTYGTVLMKFILNQYARMDYAAVNSGQAELALSVDTLRKAIDIAGLKGISTNIRTSDDHVFLPHATFEVGNRKIIILGITSPQAKLSHADREVFVQSPRSCFKRGRS